MKHPRDISLCPRRGFTLVELLVVIAIIGILAALGTWGVFAMIGGQSRRNTQNTLRVLDKMLQNRWHAVIDDAKKEPISATTHLNVFILANNDPALARVIWIKARLAEAFPVSYLEAADAPGTVINTFVPANLRKPYSIKYKAKVTAAGLTTLTQPGESSACLLMALQALQADNVSLTDQLKYAVVNRDGPTSPHKIDTLVDGWGRPLVFIRFGTGADMQSNIQLANPAKLTNANMTREFRFSDAVDADGKLLTPAWYNALPVPMPLPPTNYRQKFEKAFHVIGPAPVAPAVVPTNAYFVIPVIASAGASGDSSSLVNWNASHGLNDFNAAESQPGSKDNIYNFLLRGE